MSWSSTFIHSLDLEGHTPGLVLGFERLNLGIALPDPFSQSQDLGLEDF